MVKCIDPNEGEVLRGGVSRGIAPRTWGSEGHSSFPPSNLGGGAAPPPHLFRRLYTCMSERMHAYMHTTHIHALHYIT